MLLPAHLNNASRPSKVLIAEDSVVIGNLLRFNMDLAGFDSTLARNGQEAIDCLQSEDYDILVTDYEMPILNGAQICEILRNEMQIKEMPIVMCSAKSLELDAEDLRARYGIELLLQKPFSISELIGIVQGLVSKNENLKPR